MNWHILGAGSLGCLWAAQLSLAKLPVCLILRNEQSLANYQQQASVVHYQAMGATCTQQIAVTAQLAQSTQSIRQLVVACKAYDAVAAITALQHRLTSDCCIYLLQNGLGSQQAIAEQLPQARVMAASTTRGAFLPQPFHCVHAGAGSTLVGDLQVSRPPPSALQQWQQAGIDCQWSNDIGAVLWRKLAINCIINPLTVLLDCTNGQLQQQQVRIRRLTEEMAQLLTAAGYPSSQEQLFAQVMLVIQNTAENTSSMLQDVRSRRRTEIAYISGFSLQKSRQLDTPHQHLFQLHQQLQEHLRRLQLPCN